jgi:prepilin peptidase CpaA
MMIEIVLGLALLISLLTDIKHRKILNVVTLPLILFGLSYFTFINGWEGFLFSGKGFLVGLSLLLIPYVLGGMGAGDVKLMAAIGSMTGPIFVLNAFVYIALIGGGIALFLIMKKRGFWFSIKSFFFTITFLRGSLGSMLIPKEKESSILFPYGIAIVSGTVCAYLLGGM